MFAKIAINVMAILYVGGNQVQQNVAHSPINYLSVS